MINFDKALEKLKEGNEAFVREENKIPHIDGQRRDSLTTGQAPFAVIVGCSDSRVPTELVFNQGLGDLFIVRVAGNVVDRNQLGSVEYGVDVLGAKLVVVLGHESCGAVDACLNLIDADDSAISDNLRSIIQSIKPAALQAIEQADGPERLDTAIKLNVDMNVARITEASEVMAKHVATGNVKVIGAKYSLSTGRVTFFE